MKERKLDLDDAHGARLCSRELLQQYSGLKFHITNYLPDLGQKMTFKM